MTPRSSSQQPLSQTLIGTWELLSRVDQTARGDRRVEPSLGDDPIALLYYDASGYFAAQFMKRHRDVSATSDASVAAAAPGALNNSRAQGGYDAYFGTYTVDETHGIVTQRLLGALSAEHVGQVLTRAMTVDGDTLTIRVETSASDGEPVTRTLVWRRVGSARNDP